MWQSCSVAVGVLERCLPAYTSRRSRSGSEVCSERRVVRFWMLMFSGTLSGIVSPVMVLTKIWTVSATSGVDERELEDDEDMVVLFVGSKDEIRGRRPKEDDVSCD